MELQFLCLGTTLIILVTIIGLHQAHHTVIIARGFQVCIFGNTITIFVTNSLAKQDVLCEQFVRSPVINAIIGYCLEKDYQSSSLNINLNTIPNHMR